ncbi:helical backbone metal receptor [Daejeonella oryzae]|uniref:helical backbone metal receptor n=1 Tax=Daejeonella oryzae TaxID=1122943 RepID=UPI0004171103|nr:helical backbone metal receptor [Daejeonella oryzae]
MQNRTFTDQMNRQVSISYPPVRIISLVPSQSELLFYLGLDKEIVGITKFCIHPAEKFKTVSKVGGTKKLNLEMISKLKPDLVIGNKEENDQAQIEELIKEFPVWMSDIYTLDDALDMIVRTGKLVNKSAESENLASGIRSQFDEFNFNQLSVSTKSVRVAYFIWKDPYMVAASGTFINDILHRLGFENAFDLKRYPEIKISDLAYSNPDVIFLSSEPYPFKDKHIKEFREICPQAEIRIVDGEMFSWYGSRLLQATSYYKNLINEFKL